MTLTPWARRRYTERCPAAVEHVDRLEAAGPGPEFTLDATLRVSGLVGCPVCKRMYYDHPRHPWDEYLTVTCEGKVVKL